MIKIIWYVIRRYLPDRLYLKILWYRHFHKRLNLKNPKTFNEKLQWLKLYDRNPIYTQMVDKYEVRDYIKKIIGEEYLIPLLGVWNSFDEIDFSKLPNQFVLKCTHDSGGIRICKDKNTFDFEEAKIFFAKRLKVNYFYASREWPYKNVKPRIIAEKYMTNDDTELADYKVHNFNGIPKFILVCKDRFLDKGLSEDFFNCGWKHLDLKRPDIPNSDEDIEKPESLKEMLELSEKLSKNITFVRTDFYEINGKLYFGEITFYPASGFEGFEPDEWDSTLGKWLKIEGGGYLLINKNYALYVHEKQNKNQEELTDYKFMCFNGKVECSFVVSERFSDNGLKVTFYDREWNIMPFERHYPRSSKKIDQPKNYNKMLDLAEKLSKDIAFVRIDFYESHEKIYFGEMTFFPGSGFEEFTPDKWDRTLGDMIDLNKI